MKPLKIKITIPAAPVTDVGCIDLRALAGDEYRLQHDHKRHLRPDDDPWHVIIPCERGHIYPHSGTMIGYASNTRGTRANQVAALTGAEVLQDADDGINVAVPAHHWEQFVAIVKPRRRRHLSPQHRAALAKGGEAHRYVSSGPVLARPKS